MLIINGGKKYVPEDITIFVLTYNRAELLEQALTSLVNQTVRGFRIRVLDNASSDNTLDVVKKFIAHGVEFNESETNKGSLWNFERAQALISTTWVMVFHDDDLLHPSYLANVLELLNHYPESVSCNCVGIEQKDPTMEWSDYSKDFYFYYTAGDLVAHIYSGCSYPFSSVVYRSDIFATIKYRSDLYGKIADRAFVLDVATYGQSLIMKEPFLKIRIHEGQDTFSFNTHPSSDKVLSLLVKYRQLIGQDITTSNGRIFWTYNFFNLLTIFRWCSEYNTMSYISYLNKAIHQGATNPIAIISGTPYVIYCLCRKVYRCLMK